MILTRRGLLGALAAMAAPAIVSPKIIMPIRPRIIVPPTVSDLGLGDFTMEAWVRKVPSDWFTHTMVSLDGVITHYIDYQRVEADDPRISGLRMHEQSLYIDSLKVTHEPLVRSHS